VVADVADVDAAGPASGVVVDVDPRTRGAALLDLGTDHERQRAIETLVAEIRINDQGQVIPVFKIPNADTIDVTSGNAATTTEPTTGLRNGAVGGPPGLEPRTCAAVLDLGGRDIEGPPLSLTSPGSADGA
jgi:hypothetical protein